MDDIASAKSDENPLSKIDIQSFCDFDLFISSPTKRFSLNCNCLLSLLENEFDRERVGDLLRKEIGAFKVGRT
jgi:hypothetical protein